ncbi:hypothetical protein [Caloramator proteoclasticus]|uniref:Uncharacterized protein n=1 Tax=Caloramator proteoclasticus DSM 10124 TaxID=1121262 RepID=A0A1M4ZEW5_9CLOT|nr:hypothetical protein [Caloramator proteoclasticus]SHF16146.1 hypothetical protein SAMN02746091_01890 [Caloramator proteoclasticus DSM 10124]
MYNISQLFKDLCDSNNREFEMKLIVNDEIEIDDSKIFDLEIENSIIAGETYTIGNCIASKLVVEVLEVEDIPLKAKVIPYLRIKDSEQTSEWLQLGIFYIEEKRKTQNRFVYTCYDALFYSDKKYISQKTLPTTTIEILNEIKTLLGIEADISNVNSYPINYHIDGTIREALSEIATMNAGNFIIDNQGVLRLIKLPAYNTDSIKSFTGSDYINIQYKNECAEFSKLIFTKDSVEYTKGEGTEEKTFNATGREYFINNQFETILNNIYSSISLIKYTPISAIVKAYPYLQVGDKIKIVDYKTNEEIDTYIMRIILRYSGGLSMQVESKFKTNEKVQNTGSIIKRAEKVVEQIKGFTMVKNENPIEVYDTSEVTLLEMPLISLQSADTSAIDITAYIQGTVQKDLSEFDITLQTNSVSNLNFNSDVTLNTLPQVTTINTDETTQQQINELLTQTTTLQQNITSVNNDLIDVKSKVNTFNQQTQNSISKLIENDNTLKTSIVSLNNRFNEVINCKLSLKLYLDDTLLKEFKVNYTNDEDYITIKYLLTNINSGEYTLKLVAKVETENVTLSIDKEGCCLYIRAGQRVKPVVKVEGEGGGQEKKSYELLGGLIEKSIIEEIIFIPK